MKETDQFFSIVIKVELNQLKRERMTREEERGREGERERERESERERERVRE